MDVRIRFAEYGSVEWLEARQLRYNLFFQEYDLPKRILDDDQESNADHLVAVKSGTVIGCGRLFELAAGVFRVSQMAVATEYQRQGLGKMLLRCLVDRARRAGAKVVTLQARLPSVAFYTSEGFRQEGRVFASEKTGVPHVTMSLPIMPAEDSALTGCGAKDGGRNE